MCDGTSQQSVPTLQLGFGVTALGFSPAVDTDGEVSGAREDPEAVLEEIFVVN